MALKAWTPWKSCFRSLCTIHIFVYTVDNTTNGMRHCKTSHFHSPRHHRGWWAVQSCISTWACKSGPRLVACSLQANYTCDVPKGRDGDNLKLLYLIDLAVRISLQLCTAGNDVSITEEFTFKETDFRLSPSQVNLTIRWRFSWHTWRSRPKMGSKYTDYMPMDAVWQELEIRKSPLTLLKPSTVFYLRNGGHGFHACFRW